MSEEIDMSPLAVAERRFKIFPLEQLNTTDLLLLDIARSLRELQHFSQAGLEFSRSLATLMVDNNDGQGN